MGLQVAGKQGAFAWSGGDMTLTSTDCLRWSGVFQSNTRNVTPFGYGGEVYTNLLSDGQGEIEFYVSQSGGTTGKPPIPSGATGTLTLTAYSGQTYSFTALLSAMTTGSNQTSNDPVTAKYRWLFSAATPIEVMT